MEPFVPIDHINKPTVFHIRRWLSLYNDLTAGISGRKGGTSQKQFQSLNCALHVPDDEKSVIQNRKALAHSIGFSFDAWTCAEQVHSNEVEVVSLLKRGQGRFSRDSAIPSKDALITNEPDLLLISFFADCVPLYYWDPVHKAIGLAHAGWKGTVLDIAGKTIESMSQTYGSKPEQLLAAIGPSIGYCCYEVDESVMVPIKKVIMNAQTGYSLKENGKYMLDLKEINRQLMIRAGILPSNIEVSQLCTSCNTNSFYSHRKENGLTGRMAAWIGIRKR